MKPPPPPITLPAPTTTPPLSAGEKGTQGSYEYLVYSNALVGVAARYGLRPVLDYGDPALAELFEAVRLLVALWTNVCCPASIWCMLQGQWRGCRPGPGPRRSGPGLPEHGQAVWGAKRASSGRSQVWEV